MAGTGNRIEIGRRAKIFASDCWICGSGCANGAKYCRPCSADVYDARTTWNNKRVYLIKKNKKT